MQQVQSQATWRQFAYVALGSNLSEAGVEPAEILRAAIDRVLADCAETSPPPRVSRLYQTPCFPAGAGPDYVNAVIGFAPRDTAPDLLVSLHRIEADFGRDRPHRWASRTLDLDLIALGDAVLPDPETQAHWRDLPPSAQALRAPAQLILPHPRLQDRAFVLVPLAEIAPDWRHPLLSRTASRMCADLPAADRAEILPLDAAV
jgi:2-amino-4-hydroxy-6-hydroxymethyldihydropteridine diphosphokinase